MVDATARRGVASLDPATGAPDSGFDAHSDGDVYALALSGSRLYLGGKFAHVGGRPRVSLARVDAATRRSFASNFSASSR